MTAEEDPRVPPRRALQDYPFHEGEDMEAFIRRLEGLSALSDHARQALHELYMSAAYNWYVNATGQRKSDAVH